MRESTGKSAESKQAFYSRPEVAASYADQRFGGASGAWVNQREIETVLSLLPPSRRILDLGCGTGRLTRVLAGRSWTVGLDASAAMLAQARQNCAVPLVQGDAFALPFAGPSFDTVVALRVAFHFADLEALVREASRVVAPSGTLIFDTYRWSPRACLPLDAARWGGGIYVHSQSQIERAAAQAGLRIVRRKACFLFSPYIYRRLPLALVRVLDSLETHAPAFPRARIFWAAERASDS